MPESVEIDLNKELVKIEEEIATHNRIVENLIWRRSALLTKKQDLEMCEFIDCIIEKGLSVNKALELINSAKPDNKITLMRS